MHRISKIAALAAGGAIGVIATATAAHAVSVSPTGTGFVGKGEVQTALGYNNSDLQKAVTAKSLSFSAKVRTSQSVSQDLVQAGSQVGSQVGTESVTQDGTEHVTQTVSQDLECTFTNGNGTKVFHRDGVRDGSRDGSRVGTRTGSRSATRDGSRDGSRTGSQAGVQSGDLGYDLDVEARKATQYTGFILKGWKGTASYTPGAITWSDSQFDDWEFGDWSFGSYGFTGDYNFAAPYQFIGEYTWEATSGYTWGDWVAAPGDNPDDCLRAENADKITNVTNVTTPGAITTVSFTDGLIHDVTVTDGPIDEGTISEGDIDDSAPVVTHGEATPTGPTSVFVSVIGGKQNVLVGTV